MHVCMYVCMWLIVRGTLTCYTVRSTCCVVYPCRQGIQAMRQCKPEAETSDVSLPVDASASCAAEFSSTKVLGQ